MSFDEPSPSKRMASSEPISIAVSKPPTPGIVGGHESPRTILQVHTVNPGGGSSGHSPQGSGSAPGSHVNSRPTRSAHVQWGAADIVGTTMPMPVDEDDDELPLSPHTLDDPRAKDALTRALEAHARKEKVSAGEGKDEPSSFAAFSEGPATEANSRAPSSDGDYEERMREEMPIYIDPTETNGLPSASGEATAEKLNKEAEQLVKAHASGLYGGFARKRRKEAAKERRAEAETKPFWARFLGGRPEGPLVEMDQLPSQANRATGGVLSSLMALNQSPPSGASTPATSAPASRRSSLTLGESDSDSDDEAERLAYFRERAAKRKSASVGQSLADATKVFTKPFGHHRGESRASVTQSRPASLNGSPSYSRSTSPVPGEHGTPPKSPASPSYTAEHGKTVPRKPKPPMADFGQQLKRIGDKLGLEVDTPSSRPEMARSGAGVFGGLIQSTGNITGAATPSASSVGVKASRPGYRLSRYSANQLPTVSSVGERPSSLSRPSSPIRSPPIGTKSAPNSMPGSPILTAADATGQTGTLSVPTLKTSKSSNKLHMPRLKDLPAASTAAFAKLGVPTPGRHTSRPGTPDAEKYLTEYFFPKEKETPEERERREWEKEKKRRRKAKEKKKQERIFITMHVAAILARQDFIMKLSRTFLAFGAPSHRLEAQIQATARVLELDCQALYLPGLMLLSFGDPATHTSEVKFLKQANGLDLDKLREAYLIYYRVIHDQVSVTDASIELDELLKSKPVYRIWQHLIIGGLAAAFIQPSAFYGSFIDCLAAIPLGALLVLVQVVVARNDLYSSLFEIVIATANAFLAAALASTGQFCFASIASGSVVLILPGYIVLCGSLELANRSIISGSVRLVYSVLYSLFLGFGLSMGSEVYKRITGLNIVGDTDYTCSRLRGADAPWYRSTISPWFFFLTAPCFLTLLALRNGQNLRRKELPVMVIVGAAGWVCNYFSAKAFKNRSDITSAIGSFVVGFLGNVYGKFTRTSPFVSMVPGILFQLPSGLSNGGLLAFASSTSSGTADAYSSGFSVATQLVQVAIGLTVGLFVATAVVNLFGKSNRRGTNLASF